MQWHNDDDDDDDDDDDAAAAAAAAAAAYDDDDELITPHWHNNFKNPNWQEADLLAICKAWRSWIPGHERQIYQMAGRRIWTRDPPDYKCIALTTRPRLLP